MRDMLSLERCFITNKSIEHSAILLNLELICAYYNYIYNSAKVLWNDCFWLCSPTRTLLSNTSLHMQYQKHSHAKRLSENMNYLLNYFLQLELSLLIHK